jgi:hypothetical protein
MGGILITDEVKNEIEIETEEKTIDDAGQAAQFRRDERQGLVLLEGQLWLQ